MIRWSRLPWVILLVLFVGVPLGVVAGVWMIAEGPLILLYAGCFAIAVLVGMMGKWIMTDA